MGRYAGIDVGFEDAGRWTTKKLSGDGRGAIAAFVDYVNRYGKRVYSPDSVAILWKGGPGTAKHIIADVYEGTPFDQAVELAESGELDNTPIPNLVEYLRRFRNFYEQYSQDEEHCD
jgi:hypothetical protein